MNDIKNTIAANITALRRDFGMTQIELAERLNYSDKAISKWERGESVPDVGVLKDIADLFGVGVDYLLEAEHKTPSRAVEPDAKRVFKNHAMITCISVVLVWLIAPLLYVVLDIVRAGRGPYWLAFVFAVPASLIVWLVFNCIWFDTRRNFLIISLLTWSVLISMHVSFLTLGFNIWQIYFLGVPGQAIIVLWSRMRLGPKK
ncbi:MAG: helix-turn-helix domain-containing protein [Clostridia bacterium]|nr:helix-turn-helix domain-containing protein [Clostridia bacterium]